MCGIAGWLDWQGGLQTQTIERMLGKLKHRGPDDFGVWQSNEVVLGHRRLSVQDTTDHAHQPMASDGAPVCLVFNGEIYNHLDIRKDLIAKGHRFNSSGDTETLLHAYLEWGEACLQKLNGMFAFAIWDGRTQQLFVARDRFGEKPFYYFETAHGVVFASELRSLLAHPAVTCNLDPLALGQYLSLNYVLSNACMVLGVKKLPPAHSITFRRSGQNHVNEYWSLADAFHAPTPRISFDQAGEQLNTLIENATQSRMISDVPLGAFLSGGIDSTVIVNAMRKYSSDVSTFSIDFNEKGFSEAAAARKTADLFETNHYDRVVDGEMIANFDTINSVNDEPMADTSILPFYFLSEIAREKVTVCLSGDGADEIFGGYETYVADEIKRATNWVPDILPKLGLKVFNRLVSPSFGKVGLDYKLNQFVNGMALPDDHAHHFWRMINSCAFLDRLIRPEHKASILQQDIFSVLDEQSASVRDLDPFDRASYIDMKTWMCDDILTKVDRCSMAHSLEVRAPYLDHNLIEFAVSLPPQWKCHWAKKKRILRHSQNAILPDHVKNGKKRGFNAPVSHWLFKEFGDYGRAITTGHLLDEWLDVSVIDKMWQDHLNKKVDNSYRLFGLIILASWIEFNFKEENVIA